MEIEPILVSYEARLDFVRLTASLLSGQTSTVCGGRTAEAKLKNRSGAYAMAELLFGGELRYTQTAVMRSSITSVDLRFPPPIPSVLAPPLFTLPSQTLAYFRSVIPPLSCRLRNPTSHERALITHTNVLVHYHTHIHTYTHAHHSHHTLH